MSDFICQNLKNAPDTCVCVCVCVRVNMLVPCCICALVLVLHLCMEIFQIYASFVDFYLPVSIKMLSVAVTHVCLCVCVCVYMR